MAHVVWVEVRLRASVAALEGLGGLAIPCRVAVERVVVLLLVLLLLHGRSLGAWVRKVGRIVVCGGIVRIRVCVGIVVLLISHAGLGMGLGMGASRERAPVCPVNECVG